MRTNDGSDRVRRVRKDVRYDAPINKRRKALDASATAQEGRSKSDKVMSMEAPARESRGRIPAKISKEKVQPPEIGQQNMQDVYDDVPLKRKRKRPSSAFVAGGEDRSMDDNALPDGPRRVPGAAKTRTIPREPPGVIAPKPSQERVSANQSQPPVTAQRPSQSELEILDAPRRRKRPSAAFVAGGEDVQSSTHISDSIDHSRTSTARKKATSSSTAARAEDDLKTKRLRPSVLTQIVAPDAEEDIRSAKRHERLSGVYMSAGMTIPEEKRATMKHERREKASLVHGPREDASKVGQKGPRDDDNGDGTEIPADSFQQLAKVSRRVPKGLIAKKWTPLPPTAIDRVSQILHNAEMSVVMRLQNQRKQTQASSAIQSVSQKLQRKLIKGLPFPPPTRTHKDEDFNFEDILDGNRNLENQLTPMLHSIELLRAQISKEEALLQAETAELDELDTNAKAEVSRSKAELKKLHILLQPESVDAKDQVSMSNLGLTTTAEVPDTTDNLKQHPELKTIVEQLQNHLDSMQTNFAQIEGLDEAMRVSGASAQDVLWRHIDGTRYQSVLLG